MYWSVCSSDHGHCVEKDGEKRSNKDFRKNHWRNVNWNFRFIVTGRWNVFMHALELVGNRNDSWSSRNYCFVMPDSFYKRIEVIQKIIVQIYKLYSVKILCTTLKNGYGNKKEMRMEKWHLKSQ